MLGMFLNFIFIVCGVTVNMSPPLTLRFMKIKFPLFFVKTLEVYILPLDYQNFNMQYQEL